MLSTYLDALGEFIFVYVEKVEVLLSLGTIIYIDPTGEIPLLYTFAQYILVFGAIFRFGPNISELHVFRKEQLLY